jgi:hypothetical protein
VPAVTDHVAVAVAVHVNDHVNDADQEHEPSRFYGVRSTRLGRNTESPTPKKR